MILIIKNPQNLVRAQPSWMLLATREMFRCTGSDWGQHTSFSAAPSVPEQPSRTCIHLGSQQRQEKQSSCLVTLHSCIPHWGSTLCSRWNNYSRGQRGHLIHCSVRMWAHGHSSGKAELSNMLRKRKMLDCIMWQSHTLFLDFCITYRQSWRVCCWALWDHSKYAGNQSRQIKEALVLVDLSSNSILNCANLYSLRTKGLFLYCSVFNTESINGDLDGQLPCRATDEAQLCEGKGVKKHPPTHPGTNTLPQNRHGCSDSCCAVWNTFTTTSSPCSKSEQPFLPPDRRSPYSYILASYVSTQRSFFS